VLAACLTVNPSHRPTCDQLLQNPLVQKNMPADSGRPQSAKLRAPPSLLQTIKLPKNLNLLKGKLPKANYDNISEEDAVAEIENANPFAPRIPGGRIHP
jgi:NIMA (never in mitosis gene a)-related kinase